MPRLSQLKGETAEVSFEIAGETVTLIVLNNAMTPRLAQRFSYLKSLDLDNTGDLSAEDQAMLITAMVDQLETFLAGWNLTDENDEPLPVSRDVLENLSFELLGTMLKEINEQLTVGKANA